MAIAIAAAPVTPTTNPQLVKTYDYTDENGELLYQVCRYEPKSFRQRRPDTKGGWVNNMDGITRVLYRMPEVLMADEVIVCEGEKDADTLARLGFCATTNVCGAKSWLDAYADFLKGKDVIICPDNDAAGREHEKTVFESIQAKANSVKLLRVPSPHKDVSDWVATFPDDTEAETALRALISKTPHAVKPLPLYTIRELEKKYIQFVNAKDVRFFNLSLFLPSLGKIANELVPGELAVVVGDTGVGKTAILQTISRSTRPIPTLFFELELPGEQMFERYAQVQLKASAQQVKREYQQNPRSKNGEFDALEHIIVCPESGLSTAQIEEFINRSELKFGTHPGVVLVDYIGLINDARFGGSRYESVSHAAEQLKVIAKRTNTIVVIGTQIARPDKKKDTLEIRLHDSKDSGSIENSAQLVLGCWRPDDKTLTVKVLKATKGVAGAKIECNFDGPTMAITERNRQDCRYL